MIPFFCLRFFPEKRKTPLKIELFNQKILGGILILLRFFSTLFIVLLVLSFIPSAVFAASASVSHKRFISLASGLHHGNFDGTFYDGVALRLHPAHLKQGTDTSGKYHSGTYYYGTWTSPVINENFLESIASWEANTPLNTWIEVELRVQSGNRWSSWYSMGVWHENDLPFRRHSVSGQSDEFGRVSVDTLVLNQTVSAVQARVTLFTTEPGRSPVLTSLGLSVASGKDEPGQVPGTGLTSALDVPMRSQMVYPDGGEVWCSPTSVSMVMAYWAKVMNQPGWDQPVPQVVTKVWDYVYDGGGNWAFNTAYAASAGLEAKVVRLKSLADAEQWIAHRVPVIASIAYGKGELPGSPIPSSNGHLLVIRGFDEKGDVLTNDPAGPSDGEVRITYPREAFEKAFLNHSNGTVYLIYPKGWDIPQGDRW
jgi:hypothetical protein